VILLLRIDEAKPIFLTASTHNRHWENFGICTAARPQQAYARWYDNCKLLEEQGGISMFRKLVIGALGAMAVLFSTTAFAQGTAADANAMLEKTVAAIKADKTKTLGEINAHTNGFLVGDIYPFCFNLSDGVNVAAGNPNDKAAVGKDVRANKDATGDAFGQRLYDAAKEGQVNEVSYKFPKPGADKTPAPKVAFVTAVDGLGCGVGYYK
jgi:Single Cache domain 2